MEATNENEIKSADNVQLPPAVANQFKNGLLHMIDKEMEEVRINFKEALNKQERMGVELEQLNIENSSESRQECQELFYVVKECTDKLQLIKKQMLGMHQEVKQLKKRSDNLLKFRDKELSILRQKQLQEEDLIAKSSPSNKESN